MEIIDISVPIRTGMVTYPGDPEVRLERALAIADGGPANISELAFGVHTGTHVDAPVHFLEGAAGVETLPPDVLNGPCEVVAAGRLDVSATEGVPEGAERVVFKTGNSELWAREAFAEDFERLDGAAPTAVWLSGGYDSTAVFGAAQAVLRASSTASRSSSSAPTARPRGRS